MTYEEWKKTAVLADNSNCVYFRKSEINYIIRYMKETYGELYSEDMISKIYMHVRKTPADDVEELGEYSMWEVGKKCKGAIEVYVIAK